MDYFLNKAIDKISNRIERQKPNRTVIEILLAIAIFQVTLTVAQIMGPNGIILIMVVLVLFIVNARSIKGIELRISNG